MAQRQGEILTIQVTGVEKIKANLMKLKRVFPEQLAAANLVTADEMIVEAQRHLRENDTIVTGDLYNSLRTRIRADGLEVSVGSVSPYAPYVEFGTRPHFPPLEPIRAWCRMRGIPESAAFPIARAIAERGTPEQPFLYPAYLLAQRRHVARVRVMVANGVNGALR